MPLKIIGKSSLGELGFCQVPSKMGANYFSQLKIIKDILKSEALQKKLLMTSMTGSHERKATNNEYLPKIRDVSQDLYDILDPEIIYHYCIKGLDKFRPGCDFIVWDSNISNVVATTFSREAPILAFESSSGKKALGVILRPSLMKYGDYLFSSIKEALGGSIEVTLVTCNHFEYPDGSIPSIIQVLTDKYDMKCIIGENSEKNSECYHRGEAGNHVVAMW